MHILQEPRNEIAAIDEQMAALFQKRMEAVEAIAEYKREHGLPIEDAQQEAAKVELLSASIENDALRPFYVQFLESTMEISKAWQRHLIEEAAAAREAIETD